MSEMLENIEKMFCLEKAKLIRLNRGTARLKYFEWLIEQAKKVEELEKQNNQYKEALEFYADQVNYELWEDADSVVSYVNNIDFDEGSMAREALGRELKSDSR